MLDPSAVSSAKREIVSEVARRIRLVVFDVDGVLTNGGVFLGATASGERVELKRFDISDGQGLKLLQRAGIMLAIITGRESEAVRLRAEELGIEECHQDRSAAKLPIAEALRARHGIAWDEMAYLGDDLPDLPVLNRVGLPSAVASAAPEVKEAARWISSKNGGEGAARELAEALLRARGEWKSVMQDLIQDLERA